MYPTAQFNQFQLGPYIQSPNPFAPYPTGPQIPNNLYGFGSGYPFVGQNFMAMPPVAPPITLNAMDLKPITIPPDDVVMNYQDTSKLFELDAKSQAHHKELRQAVRHAKLMEQQAKSDPQRIHLVHYQVQAGTGHLLSSSPDPSAQTTTQTGSDNSGAGLTIHVAGQNGFNSLTKFPGGRGTSTYGGGQSPPTPYVSGQYDPTPEHQQPPRPQRQQQARKRKPQCYEEEEIIDEEEEQYYMERQELPNGEIHLSVIIHGIPLAEGYQRTNTELSKLFRSKQMPIQLLGRCHREEYWRTTLINEDDVVKIVGTTEVIPGDKGEIEISFTRPLLYLEKQGLYQPPVRAKLPPKSEPPPKKKRVAAPPPVPGPKRRRGRPRKNPLPVVSADPMTPTSPPAPNSPGASAALSPATPPPTLTPSPTPTTPTSTTQPTTPTPMTPNPNPTLISTITSTNILAPFTTESTQTQATMTQATQLQHLLQQEQRQIHQQQAQHIHDLQTQKELLQYQLRQSHPEQQPPLEQQQPQDHSYSLLDDTTDVDMFFDW